MYKIDKETYRLIIQLCDLALKAGGLQNKDAVDYIVSRFESNEEDNKD